MASRVRVATSACLVASGLFIGGAGAAMALADPGHGYDHTSDVNSNDGNSSDGNSNDGKAPDTHGRPESRWGNGRDDRQGDSGEQPTKTATATNSPTTKPTDPTTKPTEPPTTKPSPCPDPTSDPSPPPGQPPPNPPQSGGGGGATEPVPQFTPPRVPPMQLPGELQPGPGGPGVLDAGAGAAAVAPAGPALPIALPVIVAPPIGAGAGGAGAGAGASGPPPAAPRAVFAEPPAGRVSPPAKSGGGAGPNSSFRIGYSEYLRSAGLPQVAALAVPGLAGILVLTGAGGLVGYRQARAGHAVRVGGSARFMR